MANDKVRSSGDDDDAVYEARTALQDLDVTRASFGHRLATPWWYKAVSALIVGMMFVGVGMPYESLSLGSRGTGASLVAVTVVAGPVLLRELLKRTTGASFDRYRNGWTAFSMALIALLVLCALLQAFADLEFAPLVGAFVGCISTFLYEKRTDQRLAHGKFPAEHAKGRV